MTVHRTPSSSAPWVEVVATDEDWDAADPELLTAMFGQLVLIRTFEEYVLTLAAAGLVHGPAHSSIGQEGGAVGSVLALTAEDMVNGSHRGHHQFLAKALAYVAPKGFDLAEGVSADIRTVVLRTLAEICGLARGYSSGRGGSMHLQWKDAGAMGTNAIVGGGVPLAAGYAWAARQAGTDAVAVTYFGDGAANIGSTLETFNLAAAWRLPVCFFIENNQYAVSTSVAEATGEPRLSARGPGFGIASWRVDGMDPLAVHLAMQEAVAHLRAGSGPALVEADTYRFFHQNGPFPGSAFRYRTKEEEDAWRARDPILAISGHLVRRGLLTRERIDASVAAAKEVLAEAADVLFEPLPGGKPDQRQIRPSEWPDPAFVDVGVRGDLAEFAGARFAELDSFPGELRDTKFIDAVAAVLGRRMASLWARTCTGSTAAPTAPPAASPPPTRTGCWAPRSARTPSPAWRAGSRWTGGSVRSSSSCTPTSCGWPRTSCSTRWARRGTCSAAPARCLSCCAARSRPAPATGRSTPWTRPASSRRRRAGGSSRPRRRSTTSAC
jgi:2-oxoisovalerate dehydrogenase E1 component